MENWNIQQSSSDDFIRFSRVKKSLNIFVCLAFHAQLASPASLCFDISGIPFSGRHNTQKGQRWWEYLKNTLKNVSRNRIERWWSFAFSKTLRAMKDMSNTCWRHGNLFRMEKSKYMYPLSTLSSMLSGCWARPRSALKSTYAQFRTTLQVSKARKIRKNSIFSNH